MTLTFRTGAYIAAGLVPLTVPGALVGAGLGSFAGAALGLTLNFVLGVWVAAVMLSRMFGSRGRFRDLAPVILVGLASLIGGRSRHWRGAEWAVDLIESSTPVRHAAGLVWAALVMRAFDLGGVLIRGACWMLASNLRTWGVLIPIMVAALHDVITSQGWGSGVWTLLSVPLLYYGIEWLRRRWGVTVKQRKRAEKRNQP